MKDDMKPEENYLGRPISILREEEEYRGKMYPVFKINYEDPTVRELKHLFGESTRFLLPSTMSTADYKPTRLNVRIAKRPDDSWVIVAMTRG